MYCQGTESVCVLLCVRLCERVRGVLGSDFITFSLKLHHQQLHVKLMQDHRGFEFSSRWYVRVCVCVCSLCVNMCVCMRGVCDVCVCVCVSASASASASVSVCVC